jgi:hypothetical protein
MGTGEEGEEVKAGREGQTGGTTTEGEQRKRAHVTFKSHNLRDFPADSKVLKNTEYSGLRAGPGYERLKGRIIRWI